MNTITPAMPIEDMTVEQFGATIHPQETPVDYFVVNMETGKLELHFAKDTYMSLDADAKKRIKGAFLWGRNSGCWISRCKVPNLYSAQHVAESLGLFNAGKTGERLTFAEQMAAKAEKAERRADRFEHRAEAAEKRGEALQAPINHVHGDIAFFTQPNINTSAGRAFTRRREKMWQSFEKGIEEFHRSAYWQDRANTARAAAEQKELQDKYFVTRRIRERERDIRALRKSLEDCEGYLEAIDRGETPHDEHGWEIKRSREEIERSIEHYLDRLEVKLDELGFYQDCLDACDGVAFGPENVKAGYIVRVQRWGLVEVVSTGPKNFKHKMANGRSSIVLSDAYAAIIEIVKAVEPEKPKHPFSVGDTYDTTRWVDEVSDGLRRYRDEKITVKIIRASDTSVTLQIGNEKPFVRKPRQTWNGDWAISIGDNMPIGERTWIKRPVNS